MLQYGVHTFGVQCGWIKPGGRHWMVLPNYDSEVRDGPHQGNGPVLPRGWLYARAGSGHCSVAEHQLAELRDWAVRSGYRVVGQSCERAQDNAFWRPGLFAMLKAVRRGEVDDVAVTRLSRFACKRSKFCKILAELQANDVMLITTDVSLRYQLYLYGPDRVIADCPKERNRCAGIHTANA